MLVMAIEAAKQMAQTRTDVEISGYTLKDVHFLKSMTLTSDFDGVEVEFHLRPLRQSSDKENSWEEFYLYVYENEAWTENCRGCICVQFREDITEVDQGLESSEETRLSLELFHNRKISCDRKVNAQRTYEAFDSSGLGFGPAFRTVQNGFFNHEGEAVAEVLLHKWWSEDGEQYQRPYVIHPTALDGLLQLPFLALSEGGEKNIPSLVPTGIKKLWVSNSGLSNPETASIKICNKSSFRGFREAESNAIALNYSESELLVAIEGYEMVALGNKDPGADGLPTQRTQCFNVDHRPDVELLDQHGFEAYSESIVPSLAPRIEVHRARELIMNLSIVRALQEISTIDETKLKRHHRKYIEWMRHRINIMKPGRLQELLEKAQDPALADDLRSSVREGSATGKFLVDIGENIADILSEKVDALELFFSGDLVKDHYIETNEVSNVNSFLLYLDALVHKNPGFRILEIGAGTGGMTRHILKTLTEYGEHESRVPRFAHYTYTDISSSFFEGGQEIFKGFKDRVTFKTLDIEKCPLEQGFQEGAYDFIMADNVSTAEEAERFVY